MTMSLERIDRVKLIAASGAARIPGNARPGELIGTPETPEVVVNTLWRFK
jgi:hypothetical protein